MIGKVKARGVGEKMATVGVSGSSVVTSRAEDVASGVREPVLAAARAAQRVRRTYFVMQCRECEEQA